MRCPKHRRRPVGWLAGAFFVTSSLATAQSGPPVRLNPALSGSRDVVEFRVAPDGQTVVYRADQETDEVFELWSVPVGGGSAVKLNGVLASGADVLDFRIADTGDRVIYRVGPLAGGLNDLYSVPIGGGASIRLNDDETSALLPYDASPDGATVVFYARNGEDFDPSCLRHAVVPMTGGALLLGGCPFVGDPYESPFFRIDSTSQWVVYTQPNHGGFDATLLRRRLDGTGGAVESGVTNDAFDISPDGSLVGFVAGFDLAGGELLTAPMDGGSNSGSIVAPGYVADFLFTPVPVGGDWRLVYAYSSPPGLRAVAASGGVSVPLTPTPLSGSPPQFEITSDGTRVVFRGAQTSGVDELFGVDTLGGPAPIPLNDTLTSGGDVISFRLASHDPLTVYRADQDDDDTFEIYAVPVSGGSSVRLNDALPNNAQTEDDYRIAPDDLTVVFRQTEDPPGPTPPFAELYEVSIAGGGATRLNDDLPSGGSCLAFETSGDRRNVVFLADADTAGVQELYSVPRIVVCATNDPLDDDGICESFDNCPTFANPAQDDGDFDHLGDACDPCPTDPTNQDTDGDGVCDLPDNCPAAANPAQADSDGDGAGDACDPCPTDPTDADVDVDGVCDVDDNCPADANGGQEDQDADGIGDACDTCPLDPMNDVDGDTLCADFDNCPTVYNFFQEDADSDGAGDACDCAPNDPQTSLPESVVLGASRDGPGSILLSWSASSGADGYTVLRGTVVGLPFSDYGACLVEDLTATSTSDGTPPAPDSVMTYLIVPVSAVCGDGGLGADSSGTPRANANPSSCLP